MSFRASQIFQKKVHGSTPNMNESVNECDPFNPNGHYEKCEGDTRICGKGCLHIKIDYWQIILYAPEHIPREGYALTFKSLPEGKLWQSF